MLESSPREEIQRYCQGKFLSMAISRGMSFSPKRWCCATGAKLVTCLARIVLLSHPLKKTSGCLSLSRVLLLHGIQALDSWIILQKFFLALNLCNNLLLRRRMWLEGITLEKFLIRIRILNQTQRHPCDSDLHYKCNYWAKHTWEKFGNSLGISIISYIF